MSPQRSKIDRTLMQVFGGYALGLIVVFIAVAVFDSSIVMAVGLVWILAVFAYAKRVLRCPLCGAVLFLAPVSQAVPFVLGRTRRCPRCRADIEEATAELDRPTANE